MSNSIKPKTRIQSDLFNWIRNKFIRLRANRGYANTYKVAIYIEHPDLPGHIHKQELTIDANNRAHARFRIAREIRMRIGTARRYNP